MQRTFFVFVRFGPPAATASPPLLPCYFPRIIVCVCVSLYIDSCQPDGFLFPSVAPSVFWALLNERETRWRALARRVNQIEREKKMLSCWLSFSRWKERRRLDLIPLSSGCNLPHHFLYKALTDWPREREKLKMDQNSLDVGFFFVEESLYLGVWREGHRAVGSDHCAI